MSNSHALILAAGELQITPRVAALAQSAKLVIAADGGARHALALGLQVTRWVGDFDSSQGIELNAPRQTFPREKDNTDLELAILSAKSLGATSATILGAFGGRFDHTLAIALCAAKESLAGFEVVLEGGREAAWVMHRQHTVALEVGQTFSLLALTLCRISLRGAKWNLDDVALEVGAGLGISNLALGELKIQVQHGCALLVAQYDVA